MGIGDWGLGPIPNPQSPIPIPNKINCNYKIKYNNIIYNIYIYKIHSFTMGNLLCCNGDTSLYNQDMHINIKDNNINTKDKILTTNKSTELNNSPKNNNTVNTNTNTNFNNIINNNNTTKNNNNKNMLTKHLREASSGQIEKYTKMNSNHIIEGNSEDLPILNIKISSISTSESSSLLRINHLGIIGGNNNTDKRNDNIVFFGTNNNNTEEEDDYQSNLYNNNNDNNINQAVDYIIPSYTNNHTTTNNSSAVAPGRHFCIYFDYISSSYYIKDLCNGLGIYSKIFTETLLKDKSVINIGESYIFMIIDQLDNITMKIFTDNGSIAVDPM